MDNRIPQPGEVWKFWNEGQPSKIIHIAEGRGYPKTMHRQLLDEPSKLLKSKVEFHAEALMSLMDQCDPQSFWWLERALEHKRFNQPVKAKTCMDIFIQKIEAGYTSK